MNEQPTRDIVRNIISKAGFKPYDFDGSYYRSLSHAAEKQTEGRTHYFDRGTRRYFNSRVLKLLTLCHGAVIGAIERVTGPAGEKLHRAVFFDFTGTVIKQTEVRGQNDLRGWNTYVQARKEFELIAETLDWAEVLKAALANEERKAQRKLADVLTALVEVEGIIADHKRGG